MPDLGVRVARALKCRRAMVPDLLERRTIAEISLDISLNSVFDDETNQPLEFNLDQNWPNPFNSITSISYSLDMETMVTLDIYDISGRLINSLQEGRQIPGKYRISFDASNLPNGIYLYRLKAGSRTEARKMVVMK